MENKIQELKETLNKSKELIAEKDEKNTRIIKKHDVDVVLLITQGLLNKIELNEMQIILKESIDDKRLIKVIEDYK